MNFDRQKLIEYLHDRSNHDAGCRLHCPNCRYYLCKDPNRNQFDECRDPKIFFKREIQMVFCDNAFKKKLWKTDK